MKSIAIQIRKILLATWKLSTRAVRRLDGGVSVFDLTRLAACLLGAASLAAGQDTLIIDTDGTVKINRMVIEPLGNATVNGLLSINGSLKLGGNAEPATAGMIRWTGADFEGYDGKKWLRFTAVAVTPVENMVRIEPGEFRLRGVRPTLITHEFWIGKYEVTQKEYEAVIGSNPSKNTGNEKLPVDNVSWNDALFYCAKLTIQERKAGRLPVGYGYRLPTEAEWEYACRAGTTTKYSFGDDDQLLGDYAWFLENAGQTPHPVGEKKPNKWGLHDMCGNIKEWCQDYSGVYAEEPLVNPTGPTTGTERIMRGGAYINGAFRCESADCDQMAPPSVYNYLGFRVVLAPRQR